MDKFKAAMGENYFEITVLIGSDDHRMFADVINQGIDAHLEGFVKSGFGGSNIEGHRMYLYFHRSEMQIIIRRLLEIDSPSSVQWALDIVETNYGVDTEMEVRPRGFPGRR